MTLSVIIGLSAVVVAIQDGEAVVLTVRPHDARTDKASTLAGLPFGPFDPLGHRTFDLAVRAFVTEQTRFELGYVEQLYTFGDKGRDAPRAEVGAGSARVVSVGYLALAPYARDTHAPDTAWSPWSRFFPWEDWRQGRPALIDETIRPAPLGWSAGDLERLARARLLFALDAPPGTRTGCWTAITCSTKRASPPNRPQTGAGQRPHAPKTKGPFPHSGRP